jgi:XapX domain-containing protein
MNLKFLIGVLLGFGIGFGCWLLGIPSPAPPVLVGALLVVAMTCGYQLADRYLARRQAASLADCGGPTGVPPSSSSRSSP